MNQTRLGLIDQARDRNRTGVLPSSCLRLILRVFAALGAPKTSGNKLPRGRRETNAAVLTERQVLSVQTVSRLLTLTGPLTTEGWRDHQPPLLDKLRQLPTPWTNRLELEAAPPQSSHEMAGSRGPSLLRSSIPPSLGFISLKRLPRLLLFSHFSATFII